LAVLVSLAVAVSPIAVNIVHAAAADTALTATSSECCPSHGAPCEKEMPEDCDLACAIKCAVSNSAIVAPEQFSPDPPVMERPLASAELLPFSSQSPPLPPPRL
jgi:hypothetical protein